MSMFLVKPDYSSSYWLSFRNCHFTSNDCCLCLFLTPLQHPGISNVKTDYYEEYTRDFQLPIGPTLSKGTVEQVYLVVVIYIPNIILFLLLLAPSILGLWEVLFLILTSILPSVIQSHTGTFVGTGIQRCASLHPLPFPVAVLIQTLKFPKYVL